MPFDLVFDIMEEEIKILSPRFLYHTRERHYSCFYRAWTLDLILRLSTECEDAWSMSWAANGFGGMTA